MSGKATEVILSLFSKFRMGIYFLLALAAIYLRAPLIFHEPRMWAEEGQVYYKFALGHSFFESLIETYFFGYFNLWANFSTLMAKTIAPMESAASVTLFFSLVVILIPVWIILSSKSKYFDNDFKKLLAIALYLLTKMSAETWLTNISSQYYFGFIAFLLLLETEFSQKKLIAHCSILFVAGLSGVQACFLAPFYFLRWFKEKSKAHLAFAIVLSCTCIIQFGVIYKSKSKKVKGNADVSTRLKGVGPSLIVSYIASKTLYTPILPLGNAQRLSDKTRMHHEQGNPKFYRYLAIAVFSVLFIYGSMWYLLGAYRGFLYLAPTLLNAVLTILVALPPKWMTVHAHAGQRYALAAILSMSMVYLIVFFEAWSQTPRKRFATGLSTILVAIVLMTGAYSFRDTFWDLSGRQNPSWKSEVQKYRLNPNHQIRIWPKGWKINVPR